MSIIGAKISRRQIENGIYNAIRKVMLDAGVIPDITLPWIATIIAIVQDTSVTIQDVCGSTGAQSIKYYFERLATTEDGNSILSVTNTDNLSVGMTVEGTGIPASTTIVSIVQGESVELSSPPTATADITATFSYTRGTDLVTNNATMSIEDTSGLVVGMYVSGSGIPLSNNKRRLDQYNAAVEVIKNGDPGIFIDLFGVGTGESRDVNKLNVIYIKHNAQNKGGIRGGKPFFEKISGDAGTSVYRKVQMPDFTTDLEYDITYKTDDTDLDRLMNEILTKALGQRRLIYGINDNFEDTTGFIIKYNGMIDMSNGTYLKRVFRYSAVDIWLQDEDVLNDTIPGMSTITFSGDAVTELPPN